MFLGVVALVSFAVTTVLFWYSEHGRNANIRGWFDVVWWWVITSATVGYGDIVPATGQGRVVTMVTILSGFFIYTNFVTIIADYVHSYLDRFKQGRAPVRATQHVVLCEYTAVADELIQDLESLPELRGREVVIVTDLVSENPYPQHWFVRGVPISPAALAQANVAMASHVFVFANLRFGDPDVKTLHVASRVMHMNATARVYVELIHPDNPLVHCLDRRRMSVLDSRQLIEAVLKNEPMTLPPG